MAQERIFLRCIDIPIIWVTAYALVNEQNYPLENSTTDKFYSQSILDFEIFIEELKQVVKKYNREIILRLDLTLIIKRYKEIVAVYKDI